MFFYPKVVDGECGDLVPAQVERLHVGQVAQHVPRHLRQRVVRYAEEVQQVQLREHALLQLTGTKSDLLHTIVNYCRVRIANTYEHTVKHFGLAQRVYHQ